MVVVNANVAVYTWVTWPTEEALYDRKLIQVNKRSLENKELEEDKDKEKKKNLPAVLDAVYPGTVYMQLRPGRVWICSR